MILTSQNLVQWAVFPEWESDPDLFHAFSTRIGGVSTGRMASLNLGKTEFDSPEHVRENRQRFSAALDINPDRMARCIQVHSATVHRVEQPGVLDRCDGLLTDTPDLFLVIGVADCLVLFITTEDRKVIGALHAGWRGITAGILPSAIRKIGQEWRYDSSQLELGISPGIGPCCYEVGAEVAEQFPDSVIHNKRNSLYLDMTAAVQKQATEAGVPAPRIYSSGRCTSCEDDYWFSYRRNHKVTGRMWGVIARKRK
ncbi:MAG TPA: peptidoglycan editing factor PgeF [bacterium]|nr:peptidoglycan editing factor PgeF [bacterium]